MLWNKQPLHTERSLGLLLPCNFWRRYLYLTCKNFSKSLRFVLVFFSRLLILGGPPEREFHLPSLFMAGIERNMFLYHLYWTPQLISFSNFIPVRKPNLYQGNKLMTMSSIKRSSKQQLPDLKPTSSLMHLSCNMPAVFNPD